MVAGIDVAPDLLLGGGIAGRSSGSGSGGGTSVTVPDSTAPLQIVLLPPFEVRLSVAVSLHASPSLSLVKTVAKSAGMNLHVHLERRQGFKNWPWVCVCVVPLGCKYVGKYV